MQKILVIITVVLSLAAAGFGYLNRKNLDALRATLATTQNDRDTTKKTLGATADELKKTKEKLTEMTAENEKNISEIADLRGQISKATQDIANDKKQIEEKDATITQGKTDMAAKDARVAELQSKLDALTQPTADPCAQIKTELKEKTLMVADTTQRLKEASDQLAVLKEREAKRKINLMRKGLEGHILAVNPSWNFVVLSLGDRNGVVNNAQMLIKRGAELIGKVRITSVEPSTSIADIVVNSVRPGVSVLPGDTVIYSGPEEEPAPPTTP